MREKDVIFYEGEVDVRFEAHSRAHACTAAADAEDSTPPGYKVVSFRVGLRRPRGGRRRTLTITYRWTGKPMLHRELTKWEDWAEALGEVERIATAQ